MRGKGAMNFKESREDIWKVWREEREEGNVIIKMRSEKTNKSHSAKFLKGKGGQMEIIMKPPRAEPHGKALWGGCHQSLGCIRLFPSTLPCLPLKMYWIISSSELCGEAKKSIAPSSKGFSYEKREKKRNWRGNKNSVYGKEMMMGGWEICLKLIVATALAIVSHCEKLRVRSPSDLRGKHLGLQRKL